MPKKVKQEYMEVDVAPPAFNPDEVYMEDHIMTNVGLVKLLLI
jgi:hypothetical protein